MTAAAPPASPDVDWLLSSASQSAAALVAIVGGFLVSRLVGIATERAGIERRLADIRSELALAQKRLDRRDDWDRENVRKDVDAELVPFIVGTRGLAPDEAKYKDLVNQAVPLPELRAYVGEVCASVTRGFEVMQPWADDLSGSWLDWDIARRRVTAEGHKLEAWEVETWRHVYEALTGRREQAKRRAEQAPTAPPVGGLAGILATMGALDQMANYRPPEVSARFLRPQLPARQPLLDEVNRLRDAEERQAAALATFERPAGVRAGLAVLVYFAASGIAVPVILMGRMKSTLSAEGRYLVVGLFLSGLAAVMAYLGWLVWVTTRRSKIINDQAPE